MYLHTLYPFLKTIHSKNKIIPLYYIFNQEMISFICLSIHEFIYFYPLRFYADFLLAAELTASVFIFLLAVLVHVAFSIIIWEMPDKEICLSYCFYLLLLINLTQKPDRILRLIELLLLFNLNYYLYSHFLVVQLFALRNV